MAHVCPVRAAVCIAIAGCGGVVSDADAPPAPDARIVVDSSSLPDSPPGVFRLSVSTTGNGVARVTSSPPGISCPGDCEEDYAPSTLVTLSHEPELGSSFAGWSGAGCAGDGPCAVVMSAAQTVSAAFSCDSGEATFGFTGGVQAFTPFSCVTSVGVDARGAAGGVAAFATPFAAGGRGGRTEATIAIAPGEVLVVVVGGEGTGGIVGGVAPGGFNGGGAGGFHDPDQAGGGGGGASDVRRGAGAPTDRVVVAAGGGGAACCGGMPFDGGPGGGLDGGVPPTLCGGSGAGATGGSQSAGGAGGTYPGWCTALGGLFGTGADGCFPAGSGGGGGGWYGGGGGAWNGGAGGSSYAEPAATNVTLTPDVNTGPGSVTIRW